MASITVGPPSSSEHRPSATLVTHCGQFAKTRSHGNTGKALPACPPISTPRRWTTSPKTAG